ncbi:hypothetical protein D9619_007596 [Psilocybe cf. subviscida]|uniref:Uncharacterized protein n=1 Tax=Psilocybe cf. subviscida TaxID=2480587 RepID=A0A8H5B3R1_9AGAR|nr:hypothetical protein D9619_007596 [Psilocybe cf. subviscida]
MAFFHLKRALMLLCFYTTLGAYAAPADGAERLTKRDVVCQNNSGNLISEINTSGCIDFLLDDAAEGEICSATGTDIAMFQQIGDAAIYGFNALGTGIAAAGCGDVAAAAQLIINTCNDPTTGLLKGEAPTPTNPNLIVMIDSSHSLVPPCNPCF